MPNHIDLDRGDSVSHQPGGRLVQVDKGIFLGKFGLMFQAAIINAARIAYEAAPTLMTLIGHVEHSNLARVRSATLAKELGVSSSTIDRHLAKLRKVQLIEPDEVEGGKVYSVTNWRICPYLGWAGGTRALQAYLNTLPKSHPWREMGKANPIPEDISL